MYHQKKGIDIIGKILDACYAQNPDALFIMSLMHQYEERGSLSKKQLQGLLLKAQKVTHILPGWLGTLEAIILKMPTRYKSVDPVLPSPIFVKNDEAGKLIHFILAKYPEHKRVLFLKSKFENHEIITRNEINELKKFFKALGLGN